MSQPSPQETAAPDDLVAEVDNLIREHGVSGAARALGISRESTMRIVSRQGLRRGTILLARANLPRKGAA